jgi:hypothetical protein
MKLIKKRGGSFGLFNAFIGNRSYTLDVANNSGLLYGSSANCKQATITVGKNNYFIKFLVDFEKDNLLIEDLNGDIMSSLKNNIFTNYIDSFCTFINKTTITDLIYQDDARTEDNEFSIFEYSFTPNQSAETTNSVIKDYPKEKIEQINVPISIQEKLTDYISLHNYLSEKTINIPYLLSILNNFFDDLSSIGEKHGFIHNDAHLENIMINNDSIKIIDYGRSLFNIDSLTDTDIDNKISKINKQNQCFLKKQIVKTTVYDEFVCYVKPPSSASKNYGYMFDIATISMNILTTNSDILLYYNQNSKYNVSFILDNFYPSQIIITQIDNKTSSLDALWLERGVKWFLEYCILLNSNSILTKEPNKYTIDFDYLVTNSYMHSFYQFLQVSNFHYEQMANTYKIGNLAFIKPTPPPALKHNVFIRSKQVTSYKKDLLEKELQFNNAYNFMQNKLDKLNSRLKVEPPNNRIKLTPLKINIPENLLKNKAFIKKIEIDIKSFAKQYIKLNQLPPIKGGSVTQTITQTKTQNPTKTQTLIMSLTKIPDSKYEILIPFYENIILGNKSPLSPAELNPILKFLRPSIQSKNI